MARRHFLVTYDISDDKRRNQVFKTLCGVGDHVQYSVFFADLNRAELASLRAMIRSQLNEFEDQVLVVDLGPGRHPLEQGIEAIGKAYQPSVRLLVV